MMTALIARAERRARDEQQRLIAAATAALKAHMRGASVEAEEARVLVSGRGAVKRWLLDPGLRFLSGDLK